MIDNLLRSGRSFSYDGVYYTRLTNQVFLNPAELDRVTDPDFTPSYWLGWVSWDDLPTSAHISTHAIDDDGNVIFEDVTRRENVDTCYIANFSDAASPASDNFCNAYAKYSYDLGYWIPWNTNNADVPAYHKNARLYNICDVNIYTASTVHLQFVGDMTDAPTNRNVLIEVDVPIVDIFDKIFSAVGTFNPNVYNQITITQDDITGEIVTRSHDGYTLRMCLQSIKITAQDAPSINPGGVGSRYIWPKPAFRIHDLDDNAYLIGMIADGTAIPETLTTWRGGGIRLYINGSINSAVQDADSGIIAGGFSGTIPRDLLQSMAGAYGLYDVTDSNFAIQAIGRTDICRIARKYDLAEIRHILGYQIRIRTTDGSNTYDNAADKYYPLVDGSQFIGTLINGESDHDRLQQWQLVGNRADPDTNNYKESDKPIYIPPDPEEGDKIGDSIGFNRTFPSGSATGLFTLYALRQAHVSQLGAKLWATLNDPSENFWQNLQFAIGAYAETGSADISSILDFISSIRIYPFALINLPGYANAGTGAIRLGTGKIALDLGSGGVGNVGIMGQYTGLIDAGSAYIPTHFEDFRDLEGVTISAYLPYIGNIPLNPAEVTGCTISAQYAVDLTSGSCVAYLLLSGRWGYYPIGVYSGTIGADIPLTASQGNRLFLRNLSQMIGLSSVFGSGVMGSAQGAEDDSQFLRGIGSSATAAAAYGASTTLTRAAGASLTPPTLGSSANFAGFGAPQTAYIQIRRAQYAYTGRSFPAATYGHRTAQRATIGALSGFTKCINPDVSKIPAPAAIQRSIKAKLEAGVYI